MGTASRRGKGLPLTFRLMLALLAGSLFLSTLVSYLASGVERSNRLADRQAEVARFAQGLAGRAAPLLVAKDDLRLALVCASVAEMSGSRILVLDRDGVVRLDTGVALGSKKLQLLTPQGAFGREVKPGRREQLSPVHGLHGIVGEVRIQYPVPGGKLAFSWTVFGGAFLVSLSLIILACLICHHWMLHVRELVSVAVDYNRGDLSSRCERRTGGVLLELQDEVHELGSVLAAGSQAAEHSFLRLARRGVDILEQFGQTGLEGHGERTCRYVTFVIERLGLNPQEQSDVEAAARLHDVGCLFVRRSALGKTGPLDDSERESLRYGPVRGADLLADQPGLRRSALIVRHVYEKYNGSGYPEGLRGDRIPLGSRLIAIAEAFDQLTTCAVQDGEPLSLHRAIDRLQESRGERFDPWLLDIFEEEMRKHPIADMPLNELTISRAGVLPYEAAEEPAEAAESSNDSKVSVQEGLSWEEAAELDVYDTDILGEENPS